MLALGAQAIGQTAEGVHVGQQKTEEDKLIHKSHFVPVKDSENKSKNIDNFDEYIKWKMSAKPTNTLESQLEGLAKENLDQKPEEKSVVTPAPFKAPELNQPKTAEQPK